MPAARRTPARRPARRRSGRLLGAVVVVGALVAIVAYLLLGPVREARETAAACEGIQREVRGLLAPDPAAGDPDQIAASFTASAARIRAQGRQVGGEVERVAGKLATAVDETAAYYRSLATGDVVVPDYSGVSGTVTGFQAACKSSLPGHG